MEIVFVLVWKMRQDIEFHKSRALMQALVSQSGAESKNIMEAFDHLREAFFPFDKNQKKDELRRMKDEMAREVKRGPLSVTVLQDPNKKKMASRLVRGDQELARRQTMTESGRTVDIDAFDKARHRRRPVS